MSIIKRHPLVSFYVIAYALSWLAQIPYLVLTTNDSNINPAVSFLLLFGASYAVTIAALIVLRAVNDPDEWRAFWKRVTTWRVSIKWYLIALLLPPAVWMLGMGVSAVLGSGFPFNPVLFATFPAIFLANLGEEIGWRGFAYPRLQSQFAPVCASLILGVLWGLIHIPLNLQFPYLIFAVALLTAMTLIMTWIWNNTLGSVLVMTIFHCALDTVQFVAPHGQTADPVRSYAFIVLAMWLVAGILVWRTKGQLGLQMSRALASTQPSTVKGKPT